jgi:hypothetical protein
LISRDFLLAELAEKKEINFSFREIRRNSEEDDQVIALACVL